jgi:2-aminoadipate transaminase
MINSIDRFLSKSGKSSKRSAIREILKLLQKPDMISFAGGLPAPETFPVDDLKKIVLDVLQNDGPASLQYGTTEGEPALRNALAGRYSNYGLIVGPDNIIITTGSQQAIDLASRVFIDPGDYVLCGLPSYLGALNTFLAYGAKLKGIMLDNQGMNPEDLEETITRLKQFGRKIKFIYLIPDFQNPSGITIPEARRKEIIALAEKYDLLIIEDSPYREIRFEGEHQKMMFEIDSTGRVITFCTFSKIFAPGFRLGWVMANPVVLDKLVMAKQTSDLCTSPLLQKIAAEYIRKGLLDKNLLKTVELYRNRRNYMLGCLRKYMPEGVSWTEPEGGLFLFITLPGECDSDLILKKSVEKNVAFVSGSTFFCNNSGRNTMRINFSFSDYPLIDEGIKRLAEVIRADLIDR